MSGALRQTLILRNPDTFEAVALVAGSELPDWAEPLVHPDNVEKSESGSGRRRSSKSE